MEADTQEAALTFIAWSRIWSSVVDDERRVEAWEALALPGDYDALKSDFWTTFHVGNPMPKVPVLLHAALNMEGGAAREDWLRVINYLGLEWDEVHLAPDQLGVACEIYACAIEREEPVLIEELRTRYLLPWCQFAKGQLSLDHPALKFLAEQFEADLQAV